MTTAVIRATRVADIEWWDDAIDDGVESGILDGARVVRDAAQESLERRVSPWGEAFAPLSPVTIRLNVSLREGASLRSSFVARKDSETRAVVRVNGRARRYAYIQQFGNPSAQMFNNQNPVVIPARPMLPMRDSGAVDMPPEMRIAVSAALEKGVADAIRKESGGRARRRR